MEKEIVEPLLTWYNANKRALPWRDRQNAYYTWISEIMLQQTRVEAVKPYFERFVERLPNIEALANCPEEELLKLWEGLGYYSRVRNLQEAALQVMERHGGCLPADFDALLSLKGIGRYTAGAIASIAYGIPVPAVDGNVLRVITRITENPADIMKQSVRLSVENELLEVIPAQKPGEFNQAWMELGALVCVPGRPPKCEKCPVREFCLACLHGTQADFPVKPKKKPRTVEDRTVLVIQDGSRTAIQRRPREGLLAGLYELPNAAGHMDEQEAVEYVRQMELEPLYIEALPDAKHIFSHIEWRMKAYRIRVAAVEHRLSGSYFFVEKEETQKQYAIPSAFGAYTKYMRET